MMSFVSDRPASGQIDPSELTSGQLKALRILDSFRCTRVTNGWRAPGSPLVKLETAQFLGAKRLVIRRDYNGRPRLETTGLGKNTLAVADQRAARRKA